MPNIGPGFLKLSLHIFSVALILFYSCSAKSKNETSIIMALEENLKESNAVINYSTETNMKALYDKSVDFCMRERAKIWLPKAELVITNSKKIYDEIDNIGSAKNFDKKILKDLALKLNNYKQIILAADSSISKEFVNNFTFIDRFVILTNNERVKFASPILILLKNDIKTIENKIATYCNSKVGCTIMFFDTYSAIVGQNSNYLKSGSKLKINAGIGAYSKSTQPIITINGTKVELGFEGFSTYQMKVPEKSGNYCIPVNIKFMNPITGKEKNNTVNVEYTVAKTCDQ